MDKNITKRFKRKIFNRALSDANQSLDSKGERFKTWIRILLTIGIVAFSIPAFVWYREGSTQFFNFFISLLGADVFFLIGTFIYPYVIARANMWKYASILHQYMSGLDSPNIQITARKRNEGSNAWAYIHILNESYYPIEDCYVQIKAIEPSILSSVSGDVVLEWENHVGQKKVKIPGNGSSVNAIVVSWLGNEERRKVFDFATTTIQEHGCSGQIQNYSLSLEIYGRYLWEEFTSYSTVVIEPNYSDKSINIHIVDSHRK
jgi:hypothetical protein